MPNVQLAVLINLTGNPVQLSNTENPADNITVGANNVEAGGARLGISNIPDCTAQQNLDKHHLTIQTPNQTYYLWKTDSGDGKTAEVHINTQPQLSATLISGSPALKPNLNKALWITSSGLQLTDTDLIPKSQQYSGNISATRSATAAR
ncbi:MAG: hypothetical protein ACRD3T_13145 [Terriglobia bacterium]